MRAAVFERYGPPEVVHVIDVDRPDPRRGEVLVRVVAAAVTSGDARIRAARFPRGFGVFVRLLFGVFRPRRRILGTALSGVVDAVGAQVFGIAPGDEVCGMTGTRFGAHAEYVAVKAKRVTRKPATVSHEDAAAVLFGGTTALFFVRDKAGVTPGRSVLVNGASGAVGTNAVQLARHFGGTVTGVTSAANAQLVTDLGAERIIDYTAVDLAALDERFDVVLDTVGNLSIASGRRLLRDDGTLVLVVGDLMDQIRAHGDVVATVAPERVADFDLLLGLVAAGDLRVVIEGVYALDDIAAAYRRVDSGHKVGNVVVRP